MVKEIEHDEMSEVQVWQDAQYYFKGWKTGYGISSRKKRLAQELEELQGEYDDIKPLTPTGTRIGM